MLTHQQIKHLKSLQQAKQRHDCGQFLVEGDKSVRDLLTSTLSVECIYAVEEWIESNASLLQGKIYCKVSPGQLAQMSAMTTPNQVLALVRIPKIPEVGTDFSDLCLVLDKIQDPGNMGSILRTSDWFGIKTIYCSHDSADCFGPKVVQSSMGSFARVQVHYVQLTDFLTLLPQNLPVYGTFPKGDSLFETTLHTPSVIIMGSEGEGIHPDIQKYVNCPISIVRYDKGPASSGPESLNASVATAIILHEFRNPRRPRL